MTNYDWLISRLDAFIRKYYANRVIRGALIFLICLLFYILTVSVSEYYLYLPIWLKVSIVSIFVTFGLGALVMWVIIPLTKMARLGKVISHEQAATIVGIHFPEISDKLLNILQLKQHGYTSESRELIEASIDQKASQIAVIPITTAIDFSKNKRFIPYLLPLLLVGVFILVAAPNIFKDASTRLLQPTKAFEKPAPFTFKINSLPLQVVRNTDYVLKVTTEGSALPGDMFVQIGNEKISMQSSGKNQFEYTFRNVTDGVNFRMFAAGFYSQPYTLQLLQKPSLKTFKVEIDYPSYIGKKNETRSSLGDMTLPAGTTVRWAFLTEFTDQATLRMGEGAAANLPKTGALFAAQYRFMNDTTYMLTLVNKQAGVADSFRYAVQVIPDQYPVIQMQQYKDSIAGKQIVLTGTAGDDYGITQVLFNYDITDVSNRPLGHKSVPLKITPGALTAFQEYFDIQSLNLQSGQKLSYYIEAWDNDGVHGSKASRSEVMTYQQYNTKQIDSAINANSQQINSGLSNSAEKTHELQSDYKDMQTKMLQSENMDWEQQQSLKEMEKKQDQLKSQVENIKKRLDEQKEQADKKPYSDDLKEKQEDMQKQVDNLLNKELKEQMEKLQELMQKLNKEQAVQTMQQLEEENKLFNMDLQRMQELMKKMELQMRMEDLANKMDDMAKKERDLKSQTDAGKKDNAALNKDQQDLKKELDKAMKEDMKEAEKLNADMKQQQQNLDAPKSKGAEAQKDMQQSSDQLQQNQKSKASEEEKKAAENLEQMAASMREQASGMNMEQIEMDIHAVRQILTNLIRLSFDQEDLMKSVLRTPTTSPTYLTNQQEQNRLHSNSYMIRDSLFSLSKHLSKLSVTVNKETTQLERNMAAAVDKLENRQVSDAAARQQYVMTHTNNLALMLNEILGNLLEAQSKAQKQPGNGSCSKPGGMNPKPGAGKQLSDIITKQQQLGSAMQQMQDAMAKKDGQKPGEKTGDKPGQKPGQGKPGQTGKDGQSGNKSGNGKQGQGQGETNGENGDAEQIARMAEQQASIRRQLQELNRLLNSKGLGNSKEMQDIQQKMDKTETDLVNRRFNSEFQQRQREILTRLLETEKSLRQQEEDDKRSSKSAQEISRPIPPELQKYIQDRQQLLELYKTVPPQLKPYYRSMVEQYFQMIGNK